MRFFLFSDFWFKKKYPIVYHFKKSNIILKLNLISFYISLYVRQYLPQSHQFDLPFFSDVLLMYYSRYTTDFLLTLPIYYLWYSRFRHFWRSSIVSTSIFHYANLQLTFKWLNYNISIILNLIYVYICIYKNRSYILSNDETFPNFFLL